MWNEPRVENGLMVDLYHIDAAYIAWRSGITASATFDLYTRHAPFGGSYLLTAGLEPALSFVSNLHFGNDEIAFLRALRPYEDDFLTWLRELRFSGEILAMAEGEVAFANEPLARVTASFIEALLLESGLLHAIGVSTLIATKAARIVLAAAGRSVAEFGYRRAQAPFLAARSGYIGGCDSTSLIAAARRFGIPASGTIPHALVQAFPTELDAFRAVAETFDRYSLLLDTYDVEQAIQTAVEIAHEVEHRTGNKLSAVQLDSGDLDTDSRFVRSVLDDAGLRDVLILASGELDEWRVAALVRSGAPFDGFGVGTSLATGGGSAERGIDGGALGAVYKLVWYEGVDAPARIKIAGDKSTWPGKKQVARTGTFERDIIQLDNEPLPANARALLHPVMQRGEIASPFDRSLAAARARARISLAELPAPYCALDGGNDYHVERSKALQEMRDRTLAGYSS